MFAQIWTDISTTELYRENKIIMIEEKKMLGGKLV